MFVIHKCPDNGQDHKEKYRDTKSCNIYYLEFMLKVNFKRNRSNVNCLVPTERSISRTIHMKTLALTVERLSTR